MHSRSYIAIPPGATIKEQLDNLGMSQKEFAVRMGMSEKHISNLINGDVGLTPETAVKLEIVLGPPAAFWNNLEANYQAKLVKVREENAALADIELAKKFPYLEMSRRNWIPAAQNAVQRADNLRRFFNVVHLSSLEDSRITKIACRRLAVTEKADLALLAWVQQTKIEARRIEVKAIDVKGLMKLVPEIRAMTIEDPKLFWPVLEEKLAGVGIAIVALSHLKGSYLQGASFVDGNKIVIGLTTRGKDADKFWFSLFHEIAHIHFGHINRPDGTSEEDENEADAWARDALIPADDFAEFRVRGDFTKDSIIRFADAQGISRGIVVGRLQNEHLIGYNEMNSLKEKYEIAT